MLDQEISKLAAKINETKTLVAFTGAGISTESRIPDFRGPQGLWQQYRPIELQDFLSSPKARAEYWRRKIDLYPALKQARPNKGHIALAKLDKAGYLSCIITQNIDGLHQKAGVPDEKVIELHGSNAYISCLSCRKRYEWEDILADSDLDKACPQCDECGGWLKPATISFGQQMPEQETKKAFTQASTAKVLLVVGSSLSVYPAAGIPQETGKSGGYVAIINNQPTEQDQTAHSFLMGQAGDILESLIEKID